MRRPSEFEWDSTKAENNAARHGIAFDEAIGVFLDDNILLLDTSRELDGEPREKAIGTIGGRLFTVVFTRRNETVRIISARRSNVVEERFYHGDRSPQT